MRCAAAASGQISERIISITLSLMPFRRQLAWKPLCTFTRRPRSDRFPSKGVSQACRVSDAGKVLTAGSSLPDQRSAVHDRQLC